VNSEVYEGVQNFLLSCRVIHCSIYSFIVCSRLVPLVVKFTIDNVINGERLDSSLLSKIYHFLGGRSFVIENLWIIGLIVLVISFFNALFNYLREKFVGYTSENFAKRLRNDLYNVILKAENIFYSKFQSGDVVQRCTSDVDNVRRFIASDAIIVWRILFMVIFVLFIMIRIDVKMTIISSLSLPVLTGIALWFFTIVKKHFEKVDEAEASVTSVLQENITGVRVVKAFTREDYEIEKFLKKNAEFRKLDLKLIKLFAIFWTVSDFIALFQFTLVIVVGTYFAVKGNISVGTLVAFTTYVGMLVWPARELGMLLSNFGKVKVSVKRINEILSQQLEELDNGTNIMKISGDIEFKDVWFGYKPEHPVLKGVSFKIRSGETVAFFGSTGSGKSTAIALLMRMYEPDKGKILVDGIDIRQIPKSILRRNIGLVPQETFLFSKTVRENISITKPHATYDEIVHSAKLASVHEDIVQLESGYDTLVGEKGINLSGGQSQRVTIARTLIKDYSILIFDDSMSAVDTETENQIRKAIREKSKSRTTIVVSHRISSIKDVEKIIVFEAGRISNIGTHDELINQPGLYQRVWKIENFLKSTGE
ncbi:MAG: ABC transporter ATP-binding protein, partial [Fervidobacterium sp.]